MAAKISNVHFAKYTKLGATKRIIKLLRHLVDADEFWTTAAEKRPSATAAMSFVGRLDNTDVRRHTSLHFSRNRRLFRARHIQ